VSREPSSGGRALVVEALGISLSYGEANESRFDRSCCCHALRSRPLRYAPRTIILACGRSTHLHPNPQLDYGLAHDESHDTPRRRSEGDTQTKFGRALCHAERQHAIESHRSQEQAQS